jgi:hypothetical protein
MLEPLKRAWREAPPPVRYAAIAVAALALVGAVLRAVGLPV